MLVNIKHCSSEIDDERVLLAPKAADQVIRRMYECINARDVEGALQYIDEKCVYEVCFLLSDPFGQLDP